MKTVTVGIPAYNEERSIKQLLLALINQNQKDYILEKIVIVSDNCTDKTNSIVKSLSKKYPLIQLDDRSGRLGKISAVNHLFRKNESDILILFDADVTLADKFVIKKIVESFKHPKVSMVGGVDSPVAPRNFFERITVTWVKIWDTAKRDNRNNTTLHQFSARVMAFSKDFTTKVNMPDSVVVDDQYLYLKARQLGEKVEFAKDAKVFYKIPSNLRDYLIQSTRYIHFNSIAISHFDSSMQKFYPISKQAKRDALKESLLHDPIFTVLALGLQVLVRIAMYFMTEKHEKGTWVMVSSTK